MNAVVFYSNTKQSESVAEYLAKELCYPIVDIEKIADIRYKNLVLVFPVHCQNIPDTVKAFLERISVENLTVIATYGKMCPGNVLYEIQNRYHKNIVAGAYVPTKHSYIENDDAFCDFDKLNPVIEKIKAPSYIRLPRRYKNPLANIFPKLRSRLGLSVQKNANCIGCNLCAAHCSFGAIKAGKTNRNCIRCLRCIDACPRHALKVKMSLPLKWYLCKKKTDEIIIYV